MGDTCFFVKERGKGSNKDREEEMSEKTVMEVIISLFRYGIECLENQIHTISTYSIGVKSQDLLGWSGGLCLPEECRLRCDKWRHSINLVIVYGLGLVNSFVTNQSLFHSPSLNVDPSLRSESCITFH